MITNFNKLFVTIFILTILLTSCCTLKDCEYEDYPELEINLMNFDYSKHITLKGYDINTNNLTDSFLINSSSFNISHIKGISDLRNKIYFIYSGENRIDTISNINYEIYEFYNDCNTCLFKDNGAKAIDFRNLQYNLNGIIFKNTEEVYIYK